MTITRYRLCVVVFAAVLPLTSARALAQTAPPGHDHGSSRGEAVAPAGDLTAKVTSLDGEIARLVADMKMFTGELKIQTMTELLEKLVERQMLVDVEMNEMKWMREHMSGPMNEMRNGPMNELRKHAPKWSEPETELEPETLCSPFI